MTKETGDAAAGKAGLQEALRQVPHRTAARATSIGPDLTGMAVHPKEHLLIDILDPSRSVEGNFRVYTVTTKDGRVAHRPARLGDEDGHRVVRRRGQEADDPARRTSTS